MTLPFIGSRTRGRPGGRPLVVSAAALLCAVALVLGPSASTALGARGMAIGLAAQTASDLEDPRVAAIGLSGAHLIVRWDAAWADPGPVDAWMAAARAAGLEPLVTFWHRPGEDCRKGTCAPPSPEVYGRAVTAFLERWPVRLLTPWNEANAASEPTAARPSLAAAYYRRLKRACPTCKVAAADLLDREDVVTWVRRFRSALPKRERSPRLWGFHPYGDANYFVRRTMRRFMRAVRGRVWLTELAGIVRVTQDGHVVIPPDELRAAHALCFGFGLARAYPRRVKRTYVYHWRGSDHFFDAGLVREDGSPRPGLDVLLGQLANGKCSPPPRQGVPGPRARSVSVWPKRRAMLALYCDGAPRCAGRARLQLVCGQVGSVCVDQPAGSALFRIRAGRPQYVNVRMPRDVWQLAIRDPMVTFRIQLTGPGAGAPVTLAARVHLAPAAG